MRARGLQLVAAALVAALVPCAARAEQLVLIPSTTTVFIRSPPKLSSIAEEYDEKSKCEGQKVGCWEMRSRLDFNVVRTIQ